MDGEVYLGLLGGELHPYVRESKTGRHSVLIPALNAVLGAVVAQDKKNWWFWPMSYHQ